MGHGVFTRGDKNKMDINEIMLKGNNRMNMIYRKMDKDTKSDVLETADTLLEGFNSATSDCM